MRAQQAKELINRLQGYWPSPAMNEQEVKAWMDVLTDTKATIQFDRAVIEASRIASTERFRPNPAAFGKLLRQPKRTQLSHKERCSVCEGNGWRPVQDDEMPCAREGCGDYEDCRCQVQCGRCDGTGRSRWEPNREPPPDYGAPMPSDLKQRVGLSITEPF